ncbi:MAG TPA: DinB family protein [Parafilimonas sp.]|nr:DinB family protein [Parafilimonas sp.]
MNSEQLPEVWLRGAIKNIPALLQPVAHALLQSREEINKLMQNFPAEKLWEKPAGVASVGFHLQHLSGVIDRLFTYARGESLTEQQLNYLNNEGKQAENISLQKLLTNFNMQVDAALKQLTETKEETLTDDRSVGRKKLPSTVIGLLFHAAEHTMRHTGQLLVTSKFLSA